MAHIRCDYKSSVLDMNTSMTVILPEDRSVKNANVVYLLHGLSDNSSGWTRFSNVELYARKLGIALVIPEVQRSFYSNMRYGLDYFTFVSDELRYICNNFFSLSLDREKNYIMGLSMGGYGALKCALTYPDHYKFCAAFSPVTDIISTINECIDGKGREFSAIFDKKHLEKEDLFYSLNSTDKRLPSFYIACGDSDSRIWQSEKMVNALTSKCAIVKYEHWSGGHDWTFWDEAVKKALYLCFDLEDI